MKNMEELFKMALGIEDPWYVESVEFEEVGVVEAKLLPAEK